MPAPDLPPSRDEAITDLPARMRSLYASGEYFVAVPPAGAPDFEDAYWHEIEDPDGERRDRLAEREQSLADLATELTFLNGLPAGRILDAGCGLGWLLSAIGDSWERFGLELSSFASEHARQYADVRTSGLEDCPFPDQFFDVVVCHHVIEHITDPNAAIAQVHRVLRPDGYLILGTPDFDSGAARRWGERYRLLQDPTHVSLFSNDSMHRFLRDWGFVIDAVDYPFFETRHFTKENLLRVLDADSEVSPPFYGNFMTFYCRKR